MTINHQKTRPKYPKAFTSIFTYLFPHIGALFPTVLYIYALIGLPLNKSLIVNFTLNLVSNLFLKTQSLVDLNSQEMYPKSNYQRKENVQETFRTFSKRIYV